MRFIRSPWFSFACAAALAVAAFLLPDAWEWLLGLAGTAAFWGLIETFTVVFGSDGSSGEARFDTRNKD